MGVKKSTPKILYSAAKRQGLISLFGGVGTKLKNPPIPARGYWNLSISNLSKCNDSFVKNANRAHITVGFGNLYQILITSG